MDEGERGGSKIVANITLVGHALISLPSIRIGKVIVYEHRECKSSIVFIITMTYLASWLHCLGLKNLINPSYTQIPQACWHMYRGIMYATWLVMNTTRLSRLSCTGRRYHLPLGENSPSNSRVGFRYFGIPRSTDSNKKWDTHLAVKENFDRNSILQVQSTETISVAVFKLSSNYLCKLYCFCPIKRPISPNYMWNLRHNLLSFFSKWLSRYWLNVRKNEVPIDTWYI